MFFQDKTLFVAQKKKKMKCSLGRVYNPRRTLRPPMSGVAFALFFFQLSFSFHDVLPSRNLLLVRRIHHNAFVYLKKKELVGGGGEIKRYIWWETVDYEENF